jgi:hypothetical protein
MVEVTCFHCQTQLVYVNQPGRREECTKCGSDVHVCRNCSLYDPTANNECREPQAEVIRERDRANFCDFFVGRSAKGTAKSERDLRAAAEALFKKR